MSTQQEQETRSTDARATAGMGSGGDADIKDPEFYKGLKSISQAMTESGASDEEVNATLQNAKQYYIWRREQEQATSGVPNEHDQDTQAEGPDASQRENASEPYPNSFNAIVELIATGNADKVPGVREIPLKINEEMPSVSTRERPEKPWEKATSTS